MYILLETKVDIISVLVRHTIAFKNRTLLYSDHSKQKYLIWTDWYNIIFKTSQYRIRNFSNLWKVNCSFWSVYEFRDGISVSARYRQCRYCVVSDPRLTSDPGDKSGDSGASNWCRSFSFIVVYPGILFLLITN